VKTLKVLCGENSKSEQKITKKKVLSKSIKEKKLLKIVENCEAFSRRKTSKVYEKNSIKMLMGY
jgi:ribosome biogenesis protein Nip4